MAEELTAKSAKEELPGPGSNRRAVAGELSSLAEELTAKSAKSAKEELPGPESTAEGELSLASSAPWLKS